MNDPRSGQPPVDAAWHSDPTGRHQHRYHDGREWTAYVADDGRTGHDPMVPTPPVPPAFVPAPDASGPAAWSAPAGGPAAAAGPGHARGWGSPSHGTWGPPSHGTWAPPGHGSGPSAALQGAATPPGGVTMREAVRRVLSKYVDFSGRAPRSEYWWWTLAVFLAALPLSVLGEAAGPFFDFLVVLLWLGTLLPSLAVGVRRLHDTDRSGWWLLIAFVPFVGGIVLIVLLCLDGTRLPNAYGPPLSR
jgi:uncharacterized membrane protein YhaH (DUF805 family)